MNSSAFQSLFISSKDGARLHLKQLNAVPHGPRPIVLLHALAMSEVMWHEMAKYTQVEQPIWAMDLRGHGQSD
jgi:pimeloyl-ACP methyl ester carboxylesterase